MCYVNLCRFLVLPVFLAFFGAFQHHSTRASGDLAVLGIGFFLQFFSKSFKPFQTNQNDIFCGQNLVQLGITIYDQVAKSGEAGL